MDKLTLSPNWLDENIRSAKLSLQRLNAAMREETKVDTEPSVPMPDALAMVRKAIEEVEPVANKLLEEATEVANGGFNSEAMERIRERELGKESAKSVRTDFGDTAPILRSELLMYVIMLLQQIETVTMSLNYLTLKNQEALLLQGMQGNNLVDRVAALEQKLNN